MGVLLALENNTRKVLLQNMLQNIEIYDSLHALSHNLRKGTRGVDFCYPAYDVDAICAMWHSFSQPSPHQDPNCWIKSGILSYKRVSALCGLYLRLFSANYAEIQGGIASDNVWPIC